MRYVLVIEVYNLYYIRWLHTSQVDKEQELLIEPEEGMLIYRGGRLLKGWGAALGQGTARQLLCLQAFAGKYPLYDLGIRVVMLVPYIMCERVARLLI